MSAAALLATAAAMAMPATGTGTANAVDIPGRYFTPADLQVLVEQTVTWTNDDVTAHSIVADDGAFRAAPLAHGATYQFTFDQPGDYAYYCSIHRGMRGTVHVSALGLTGPSLPVQAGDMAMFDTLVPAGSSSVTLERVTATGGEVVGQATPGADGKATFHVDALRPGRYRARAGELTSAVVPLRVSPRIT